MSVHRKPNGKWVSRNRIGGRQRSKTFDRKKDAQRYDARVREQKQLGTLYIDERGTMTLEEFVTSKWIPLHALQRSQRTQRHYAGAWEVHLKSLKDYPLRELTTPVIERWRADRERAGAGKAALTKATQMLSNILGLAVRHEELMRNPARGIPPLPSAPREEVRPLVPATVELIRAQMEIGDATLLSVLAYAGLRPSEADALRWGAVGNNTLRVRAAADRNGDEKSTKTGKTRTVKLLEPLRHDLTEWRLASGRPSDDALVFPSIRGDRKTDTDRNNWRARTWRRAYLAAAASVARDSGTEPDAAASTGPKTDEGLAAARNAGLTLPKVPRVYDLRHSFASLLLAGGLRSHAVARELGNNPSQIEDRYGHVIDEFDETRQIDPEDAIRAARSTGCSPSVPRDGEEATG